MADYNFSTLSPKDFEQLIGSLLNAREGWNLEAFGHGPDGGVDLRAIIGPEKVIVQCKHYRGSTFAELRRSVKLEIPKITQEQPTRYILATSQDLPRTQKDTLIEDLQPWIKNPGDVLGMRDINSLLDRFPRVEERNFKLWMASAGVIDRIVKSGIWERSEALMEEIQDRVRLYVATSSFGTASQMLEAKHVCALTGAPGVGKSMLADMLALTHWDNDWQIINLGSHEIDRCWDAWKSQSKQFFYFDDVFGQTDVHERVSHDSGQTLARLIRRVGDAANKRLVITTRTYVLREAELINEPISRAALGARECVVQVSDYGTQHRARILYNHLYFSALNRDVVRAFVAAEAYWQIIRHQNFTPRIIEQTILGTATGGDTDSLAQRILNALDTPALLWGPSFRESLGEVARRILLQLVSFPPVGTSVETLRSSTIRDSAPIDYRRALQQLEGSWVKIEQNTDTPEATISFHDPSCRDFILGLIESEPDYLLAVLEHAAGPSELNLMLGYCCARVAVPSLPSASTTTRSARRSDRPSDPSLDFGNIILDAFFCSFGETVPKYPQMKRAADSRRSDIASLVKRSWQLHRPSSRSTAIRALSDLRDRDEQLDLDLKSWIDDEIFQLADLPHQVLDHLPIPIYKLLNCLMRRGRHPRTPAESLQIVELFETWCWTASDDGDWSSLRDFMYWLAGDSDEMTDDLSSTFYSCFESWAESELENAVDVADTEDEAISALNQLRQTVAEYLGDESMQQAFETAEQGKQVKFSNYEPEPEDLEQLREATEAIEADAEEQPYTRESSTRGAREMAPSEEDVIRGMFQQLT